MKKLLKLIGKYKIFLVFSVIFAAISVVLQLYVPVLFGDAIDEVVSAHQVNFDMMWYYPVSYTHLTLPTICSV